MAFWGKLSDDGIAVNEERSQARKGIALPLEGRGSYLSVLSMMLRSSEIAISPTEGGSFTGQVAPSRAGPTSLLTSHLELRTNF